MQTSVIFLLSLSSCPWPDINLLLCPQRNVPNDWEEDTDAAAAAAGGGVGEHAGKGTPAASSSSSSSGSDGESAQS